MTLDTKGATGGGDEYGGRGEDIDGAAAAAPASPARSKKSSPKRLSPAAIIRSKMMALRRRAREKRKSSVEEALVSPWRIVFGTSIESCSDQGETEDNISVDLDVESIADSSVSTIDVYEQVTAAALVYSQWQ